MKTYRVRKRPVEVMARQTQTEEKIETLEGTMRANPGDFIITGVNGEHYPCKPDVFAKTYYPVGSEAEAAWDKWFTKPALREDFNDDDQG